MTPQNSQTVLNRLSEIYEDVRQHYLNDDYPWVIGYSGGKDSTATLQICWIALRELPPEKRTKPIYVISTDTQVETPIIVERINDSLKRINEAAQEQGLNITAHKLSPILNDSFGSISSAEATPRRIRLSLVYGTVKNQPIQSFYFWKKWLNMAKSSWL
ncbi:MAG: hypothetical protein M5U34_33410 [Chloroflexi bacterium]|nr:hypothetical protein [Chloroflexota bacterium]